MIFRRENPRRRNAYSALSGLAARLLLIAAVSYSMPPCLRAQTELGAEDDLTVLGATGTAIDPDTEIKGFTVFGSTQTSYTGAVVGPGSAVVNGVLAVSSGAYFVASSTFAAASKIFIADGAEGQLLGKGADGALQWYDSTAFADNLGNHIAAAALQMGAYGVNSSSSISAARYQVSGSTVLVLMSNQTSIGVGVNAGQYASGADNVFLGYHAGHYYNITGNGNIAIGHEAGRTLYSSGASHNTLIGQNAGAVTRASYNSFFGVLSGQSNNFGEMNTFLGNTSGWNNTTGSRNVYMGAAAGAGNVGGSDNTGIGVAVGLSLVSGMYNSYTGAYAGYIGVANSSNAALGYYAGFGASGSSNHKNSTYGYYAGRALSTGDDNTLLGYRAGADLTTGRGNIVIAYDKSASAPAAAGELNIGGLLYGDLAGGSVGISTRAPQAALDIVSTGTVQTQFAQVWRDGGGVIKASMSATGVMMAARFIGDGAAVAGIGGLPSGGQAPRLAYWSANNALGNAALSQDAGGLTVLDSSFTVQGGGFSVGGSALTTSGGRVGAGMSASSYKFGVGDSGAMSFHIDPQAGYVSLRLDGTEVARLHP